MKRIKSVGMQVMGATNMNQKRKTQSGFTLLEILVVMVIIGILASLGIGNFITSQMKARDSRRKQDLKNISTAVELFYNDYGYFPNGSGEIEGCGSIGSEVGCDWGDEFAIGGTTYMVQLPVDPHEPTTTYYYESDGTYYVLYAHLENEQDPQLVSGYSVNCISPSTNCNFAISSSNYQP